jgi:hypothetical protein
MHRPALPDLDHETVEEQHRVDVLERPLLPRPHVLDDRVGDALIIPARVERDDPVVEADEPCLALRHDLRLEAALPVPGRLDPQRPVIGTQRLRRRPIAGVSDPARRRLPRS